MIKRVFLLKQVLGSIVGSRSLLTEIMVAQHESMDLDANKTGGG